MKKLLLLLLSALLLLSGCGNVRAVSPFRKLTDSDRVDELQKRCQAFYEENQLTGLSVGVLSDGKVKFLNFGVKGEDGVAVTENTPYELGEVSQVFTGVLLGNLKAVNWRKIELTDTVRAIMPYAKLSPELEQVQLWQLASGLVSLTEAEGERNQDGSPNGALTAKDLRTYMTQAQLQPEGTAPSLAGYGVLGYAMAYKVKNTYDIMVQYQIAQPLGMKNTAVELTETMPTLATPHGEDGAAAEPWDYGMFAPYGGVKSTAHDMLRLAACGVKYLRDDGKLFDAFDLATAEYGKLGDGTGVGLGLFLSDLNGSRLCWRAGATSGSVSYFAFVPETETAVVVLANRQAPLVEFGQGLIELMQ